MEYFNIYLYNHSLNIFVLIDLSYIYVFLIKEKIGRTFAGPLMVALLPIDIGKSATLIISLKTFM